MQAGGCQTLLSIALGVSVVWYAVSVWGLSPVQFLIVVAAFARPPSTNKEKKQIRWQLSTLDTVHNFGQLVFTCCVLYLLRKSNRKLIWPLFWMLSLFFRLAFE